MKLKLETKIFIVESLKAFLIVFAVFGVIMAVLSLCSCQGSCVTVTAGHEESGINGSIQYCFEQEESEKATTPTFSYDSGDGKKYLFGIDESTLKKITDRLRGFIGLSTEDTHPVVRLKEILKND